MTPESRCRWFAGKDSNPHYLDQNQRCYPVTPPAKGLAESGWEDLNLRPLPPEDSALTKLGYSQSMLQICNMCSISERCCSIVTRWSGWPDSNRRPLAPKASALAKLSYIPMWWTVQDLNL